MISSENYLKALDELEKLVPEEWHNIPVPVTNGVFCIKSLLKIQSSLVEYLSRHLSEIEHRTNNKLIAFQKSLTENAEKAKEFNENTLLKLKGTERKIQISMEEFQQKVKDDLQTESAKFEISAKENKSLLVAFKKKIDNLPKESKIQDMIQTEIEKNFEKFRGNIKEKLIDPESKINQIDQTTNNGIKRIEERIESLYDEMSAKNEENSENLEVVENKLKSSIKKNDHLQSNFLETLQKSQASIASHNQVLSKLQKDTQALEDSYKALKMALSNLSATVTSNQSRRPETPQERPLAEIIEPGKPNFDSSKLDALCEKFENEMIDISQKIALQKQEILGVIEEKVKSLHENLDSSIEKSEKNMQELADKLAWLPINLTQLTGMTPAEARIFTLEARLRSEENSRIKAEDHILKFLGSLMPNEEHHEVIEAEEKKPLAPVVEFLSQTKSIEKKTTPGGMCTSEWWKIASESERKHRNEAESILGTRVKYSTPVPETESDSYLNFHEKRRVKAHNKANTIGIMPRIHSEFTKKYQNLKKIAMKIKMQ